MRTALLTAMLIVATPAIAPAIAQEREWTLDTNSDDEAYMTYGVPDTEDVGLSLWCKIGSNALNIFVPRSGWKPGSKNPIEIAITAASITDRVKAKIQDTQSEKISVEATVKTTSPLVQALPQAEHIDIDTGKHKLIVPLYDAPVSNLLRLCNGG